MEKVFEFLIGYSVIYASVQVAYGGFYGMVICSLFSYSLLYWFASCVIKDKDALILEQRGYIESLEKALNI